MIQISVKEVIKNKAPNIYKKLPSFVIWIARKIVCEEQLNKALKLCDGKRGVEFIKTFMDDVLHIKREVVGLDSLPKGEYIFASNHPLGGLDGLALLETIDGHQKGVKAIVNDILLNIEPIKSLFLPVNKHGRQSSDYAKEMKEHFESGRPLLTFPAGFCSRKIGGVIKDVKWNRNYITKAIEYKRSIVPVYVDERNSNFFYNIEVWRKKFGVKLNIGMMLLPREMFRRGRKRGRVRLLFGEPVTYEDLVNKNDINYWNSEIRRRCYSMSQK